MIFDNFLCLVIVIAFIGFIIGLVKGQFKVEVKPNIVDHSENIRRLVRRLARVNNGGHFATGFSGWPRARQQNRRRNRQGGRHRRHAGHVHRVFVADDDLPTYEDSTNVQDSRDLD